MSKKKKGRECAGIADKADKCISIEVQFPRMLGAGEGDEGEKLDKLERKQQ